MGLTYVSLKLENLFNKKRVEIKALVDSGATFMCVTEEIALQLGFDTTELSTQVVITADGR
ncbi:MAG: aspartyl protease family protein [Proteobacteria bacterium]|nr:aspartyl protease family protein [Pseudomonadota bacterium]